MRIPFATLFCCLLFLVAACQRNEEYRDVDFKRQERVEHQADQIQIADSTITIAVAAIISAQETFSNYQLLASYVEKTIQKPTTLVFTKDYHEAFNLISQGKVDVAFICSGLYVLGRRTKAFRLLSTPVVKGKSVYQAYLIVPANSNAKVMSDLDGKRFAMTDRLSLTGCFYPLSRSKKSLETWKDVVFSGSHNVSIDLVNRGVVDGASVDGLVYEDFARRYPSRVKNTRVIEKSEPFGIPPVVITSRVTPGFENALQNIFIEMHTTTDGKKVLDSLGFDRFEKPNEKLYRPIEGIVPETVLP